MNYIFAPLMALVLGATAMTTVAGESISISKLTEKTLPAETYGKLSKGKQLTYLWKSPAFKPALGFKLGAITWEAPYQATEVQIVLGDQAPGIVRRKASHYTLELAVTGASEDRGGISNRLWKNHGFFILEGRVLATDGSVVAAFLTKEEDQFGGVNQGPTFLPGVGRALDGIATELFKK